MIEDRYKTFDLNLKAAQDYELIRSFAQPVKKQNESFPPMYG